MDAKTVERETAQQPSSVVIGGDEVTTYRTISALSIVGLLLGIAAPLCLAAPLLLAIPLFGIAVTLLAISRVAASDGAMIGRQAALFGLALCIVSLFTVASRSLVARQLLSRQARKVALDWVAQLQAGNIDQAFALSAASTRGSDPLPPFNGPGANETPPDPLTTFREHPVVAYLSSAGREAKARYVADVKFQSLPRGQAYIQQQYKVSGPDSNHAIAFELTLQRVSSGGSTPAKWAVADYQSEELSASSDDELDQVDHGHSH